IARETGRYASRTRFCELVVNGDYRGVYVFMENIKRDRNRVNISIMDPATTCGDELTGGYIIAIDHSATEFQLGFSVSEDSVDYFSYWYIYPKSKHINDHQRWHIMHHVRDFENTMHGADYADPHTGYHQWIDVDSFVDYVLLNEWANNVDAFVASLYLHKDRASISDKIVAGPVWDFNVAFGNADYAEAFHTSGWRSHYGRVPFWWRKLLHDQGFVSALERRWGELRRTVLHDRHVMNVIDSLVTLLDEAQRRHFDRWDLLGRYHWPNAFVGETWQDEIDYLKDWILARMIWMDDSISTILWKDEVTSTRPAPNPHAFSLQAYPVPSAGDVTALIYMPPETNGTLVVRDVLGREVYQLPVGGRGSEARHVPLSLHHLPRGVYMLAIRSAGMTPAAARIVLTR
ncbi:MAG: CotH kinase family protein, partial [Bacteroidetes bacterium]|nr:CotH kinase family protein [Bacteroidota bacterium]